MNKLLNLAEKTFTIASVFHYASAPIFLLITNGISEGDDEGSLPDLSIINQLFQVIYFITFSLLLLRWKKVLPVILKSWSIWLFFGLVILSFFWSYSPELTKVRIVAMIGTMLFSLYLASRYTLKEQLQLLGWIFGIAIVTSILFAIFLPKYGLMGGVHMGAWRGVFNHKNGMGRIMVIGAITFSLLALTVQKQRWIFWTLAGASVMLIVLSRASSPLLNLGILISLLALLPILRWNYIFMVPALIGISSIGIVLYSLATNNAEQIVGAFGKNLTLTGRTDFWPLVIDKIAESPWVGYGFGAFWQGLDGPSAYVWNASAFKAPNSHNGYLDLCLDLGLIGFFIYMTIFITTFYKALMYIRETGRPDRFWPTLLLSYVVLSNLTESSLVIQNNFLWVIQLSIFFSLSTKQSTKISNYLQFIFKIG
jgi:exopolysaccharide production protein ExoQ